MKTLNYNLGKMMEDAGTTVTTISDKLFGLCKTTKTATKIGLGVDALFQSNNAVTETPKTAENTIAELQAKLEAITAERDRLKEKLAISFKMDYTTETQNLITLKNDIASGLKFEYKAFNESLEDEYNEDNFEAYRWTISRMFRTLTRLGVPIMA